MSRNYNTRQSNMKFVSHGVQGQQEPVNQPSQSQPDSYQGNHDQDQQFSCTDNLVETKCEKMNIDSKAEDPIRPHWMKTGVKKISNKERRRRQNQNLRRLVTPKSALMVLNEMVPGDQLTFKVENSPTPQYQHAGVPGFCAEVTIGGNTFKGFGETKALARTAAAENAVRDIILKKMVRSLGGDHRANEARNSNGAAPGAPGAPGAPAPAADDEPMPMIQLASFALHKLFSEWECEGHRVPQLRPTPEILDELAVKKVRTLPEKAADMHPCMLLTYMRPLQEYRELGVRGDRPQSLVFTVGVHVDGATYVGHGPSKKEARKQAATAACNALFGITFN